MDDLKLQVVQAYERPSNGKQNFTVDTVFWSSHSAAGVSSLILFLSITYRLVNFFPHLPVKRAKKHIAGLNDLAYKLSIILVKWPENTLKLRKWC